MKLYKRIFCCRKGNKEIRLGKSANVLAPFATLQQVFISNLYYIPVCVYIYIYIHININFDYAPIAF